MVGRQRFDDIGHSYSLVGVGGVGCDDEVVWCGEVVEIVGVGLVVVVAVVVVAAVGVVNSGWTVVELWWWWRVG